MFVSCGRAYSPFSYFLVRYALLFLSIFVFCSCAQDSDTDINSKKNKNEQYASSSNSVVDKFFSPGQQIPDLELEILNEGSEPKKVRLGDVIKTSNGEKVEAVLLNFWASWCVPCVKELPDLELLHKDKLVEGLRVVSINTDSSSARAKVRSLKSKFNLSFPILLDPELESIEKFHISGFPESFIVDSFGQLLVFQDPESGKNILRVLSDRKWSSPQITSALQLSIKKESSEEVK